MNVWSSVLIAIVVATGLEADLPFVRWSRMWLALDPAPRIGYGLAVVVIIAIVTRPFLALRDDAMRDVLPLTQTQRFTIDAASSALFLAPPYIAWFALAPRLEVLALFAIAILLNGRVRTTAPRSERRFSRYELRWIPIRAAIVANVAALLCLGASELAIRNNDVTRPESIARIASLFAGIAMAFIATTIVSARNAARPFRAFERTLPLTSRQRIRALLETGAILGAPAILFHARVLFFAVLALIALLLIGEHRSLRDAKTAIAYVWLTSAALAILGALHAHAAILAAAIAIPPFLLMTERSDAVFNT